LSGRKLKKRMPNQSDPNQPTDQPVSPLTSVVPPVFPTPSEDVSPFPAGTPAPVAAPIDQPTGSAAPPPPEFSVVSGPKKKFGTAKIIASILGLFILIGGVGAGVLLTRQQQILQPKADYSCGSQTCKASEVCCNDGCHSAGYNCAPNNTPISNDPRKACMTDGNGNPTGNFWCSDCGGFCLSGSAGYGCSYAALQKCGATPVPSASPSSCTGVGCNSNSCSISSTYFGSSCFVDYYYCPDGVNGDSSCIENPKSGLQSASFSKSCGVEQIDIYCPVCGSNATGGIFISTNHGVCSSPGPTHTPTATPTGTPTPTPTPTLTPTPAAPYCAAVKAYDVSWNVLTNAQLSSLTAGTSVNFCVTGTAPSGIFDSARFTIDGTQLAVTTLQRPSSTDFCQNYTILSTDTTVTVSALIHHSTLGWF
jgi:hypothetical protein